MSDCIKIEAIRDGKALGEYLLKQGEYIIGRDSDCDIPLDDPTVSRRHARLVFRAGEVLVEDLQSTAGTHFNGLSLKSPIQVRLPQTVRVGSVALSIQYAANPAPDQPQKYTIGKMIGKGGMGAVLQVKDGKLRRTVALKRMLEDVKDSQSTRLRFQLEARVLAQLEHPNIVPIHELDCDDRGQPFYTMKLVHGSTLREILSGIRKGEAELIARFPLVQLLTVFQKACDGVAFAHSKGIIHRDLKPDNIMVGEYGEVLVLDWGLAKVIRKTPSPDASPDDEALDDLSATGAGDEFNPEASQVEALNLTLQGQIMGTPAFMAPEQAAGNIAEIDERSDVFALAAILYAILTLRPPVMGKTAREVLEHARNAHITPPTHYNAPNQTEPDGTPAASPVSLAHCPSGKIPSALSAVAMKALALKKAERYVSVAELQKDIAAYQNGFATEAEGATLIKHIHLFVRRHRLATALAALLLILSLAFVGVIIASERKAKARLADLQKTAPTFHAQAKSLIEQKLFPEALEKITYAIALTPESANYHLMQGNLLQALFRFAEAREAYAHALKCNPNLSVAADNQRLCEKLLGMTKGSTNEPSPEVLEELRQAMLKQARTAEAMAIASRIGRIDKAMLDSFKARLAAVGATGSFSVMPNGRLSLDLSGSAITNLAPLSGMPLSFLNLSGTKIHDLSPLRGMALESLSLQNCQSITDLSPLRGMPLSVLDLYFVHSLEDLSPLHGLPLQRLMFAGNRVRDLTPLKNCPLEEIRFYGMDNLNDLTPLKGLPLKSLFIYRSPVKDLSPLKGLPLVDLSLIAIPATNLSPLAGMKLNKLYVSVVAISDLSPLQGMPLQSLSLISTRVNDLAPLKGMPLKFLWMENSDIKDLSPIRGMRLEKLMLSYCPYVTEYSTIADCPNLQYLKLPAAARNLDALRKLSNLKRLTFELPRAENGPIIDDWSKATTPEEFWKAYDAQKAAETTK